MKTPFRQNWKLSAILSVFGRNFRIRPFLCWNVISAEVPKKDSPGIVTYPAVQICKNHLRHPNQDSITFPCFSGKDSASRPHGVQSRKAKPRQNLRRHILSPSRCFGTCAFSVFQHVLDDCQPYIACTSYFHDLSTFCTSARMWKACADI